MDTLTKEDLMSRLDTMVIALFLLYPDRDIVSRYARLYRTSDWAMPQLEVFRLRERDWQWAQAMGSSPEKTYFSAETTAALSDAEAMIFCTGTSRLKIRRMGVLDTPDLEIKSRIIRADSISNHMSVEAMALIGKAELTSELRKAMAAS